MDLARPSGIVFHSDVGFELLSDEHKRLFERDGEVYIRGIAEEKPVTIYYTKTLTTISSYTKTPIREPIWKSEVYSGDLNECLESESHGATAVILGLEEEPFDKNQIFVEISFRIGDVSYKYYNDDRCFPAKFMVYHKRGKRHEIFLRTDELIKLFKSKGVTPETRITYTTHYLLKQ